MKTQLFVTALISLLTLLILNGGLRIEIGELFNPFTFIQAAYSQEETVTDNENTGDENTGDENTGDENTGDENTGDENTGDENTGDENTGDENTGDENTGDENTGDYGFTKGEVVKGDCPTKDDFVTEEGVVTKAECPKGVGATKGDCEKVDDVTKLDRATKNECPMVHGDASIDVETDNSNYKQKDTVHITGTVSGLEKYTGQVGITVNGPPGSNPYNGNPPISTDGAFEHYIKGIQGKEGKYTVTAKYSDGSLKKSPEAQSSFSLAAESPIQLSISVKTDNTEYKQKDTVHITGTVGGFEDYTGLVGMTVKDPYGAEIYNGQLKITVNQKDPPATDGTFEYYIKNIQGKEGKYTVTAYYNDHVASPTSFILAPPVLPPPSISVKTDNTEYKQKDTVHITGTVGGFEDYTGLVGMTVKDPYGAEIYNGQLKITVNQKDPPATDGTFEYYIKNIQGKEGKYTVTAYYNDHVASPTSFILAPPVLPPPSISVKTDNTEYKQKDTVHITGTVGGFEDYTGLVGMTVKDPYGAEIYNGQLKITVNQKDPPATDGTFEYYIKNIQGKEGKYTVTAYYNDHVASPTSFILAPPVLPPPSISVKTDNTEYKQKDTVHITGTVGGFEDYTGLVGMTVKDPYGAEIYNGQLKITVNQKDPPATDGTFEYYIKNIQGKEGKYTVTAYYNDHVASPTSFILAPPVLPPPSISVKTDNTEYKQKDTVHITGTVGGFEDYTGLVGMTVKDPYGAEIYNGQLKITVNQKDPPATDGTFEYYIKNIQGKEGKYTVTAYYNDHVASPTSFILAPPVLPPPSISVKTDNTEYKQKDTVHITGTVGGFEDYTGLVGMTVKDPYGAEIYNGQLKITVNQKDPPATDGTFEYYIKNIQGKEGKYTVTAYYNDHVAHTTLILAVVKQPPTPPSGSGGVASSGGATPFSPHTKILSPLTQGLPAAPSLSTELLAIIMITIIGAGATVLYKIKSHHPQIKHPVVTVEIRGGEAY